MIFKNALPTYMVLSSEIDVFDEIDVENLTFSTPY